MRTRTQPLGPAVNRVRMIAIASAMAAVMALGALSPAPADARERSSGSGSNREASTDWIQIDRTEDGNSYAPVDPNNPGTGNVHIGYLTATESSKGKARVWGDIADFACPDGELPYHHGHHIDEFDDGGYDEDGYEEDEWEPNGCEHVGYREIYGSGLAFSMDHKFSSARLTGRLEVAAHGSATTANPMADVVWTGIGGIYSDTYSSTYREGKTSYTDKFTRTGRNATMGGSIGPMGFAPEYSGGRIENVKWSYRSRSPRSAASNAWRRRSGT